MLETVGKGCYRLSGVLDMQNSALLQDLLKLQNEQHVELDCDALQGADSVLLAVVLLLAKQISAHQGSFRVLNFPAQLSGLATTYGVNGLIEEFCHEA